MSNNSFGALGLRASFCETLAKMGFDTPTPIQSKSIPEILQGRDVLGLAQTGTGKTAAFGLPLLQRIKEIKKGRAEPKSPRSLVLAPPGTCTSDTRRLENLHINQSSTSPA